MLFNVVLVVMVLAIAYFHYAQGLFSSAISAILAIIAAMMAIGYHELVASYVIAYVKLPEQADAIALVVLFAAVYGIGRALFDKLVPGNVQFPLLVDKIGSGVMGVIAGLFATGILALAAESMPFGPSMAGYSRGALSSDARRVTIRNASASGRSTDTTVNEELIADGPFQSIPVQSLWLHQDDMVLGLANTVSSGGALSNGTPLNTVHPDYALELFGQRLATPDGIRHIAVPDGKSQMVVVDHAYFLAKIPKYIIDGESHDVRAPEHPAPDVPPEMTLVVVRANFSANAGLTDTTDLRLRISPAGVRLKAGTADYFPLGTLVGGTLLLQNRPDDPLIIDLTKGSQKVDFLFAVNPDDVISETKEKEKTYRFKPDTFLEVMRYAQADLSGVSLSTSSPAPENPVDVTQNTDSLGGVLRTMDVIDNAAKQLNKIAAPATPAASQTKNDAAGKTPPPDGTPANQKPNELLPLTPGNLMGL